MQISQNSVPSSRPKRGVTVTRSFWNPPVWYQYWKPYPRSNTRLRLGDQHRSPNDMGMAPSLPPFGQGRPPTRVDFPQATTKVSLNSKQTYQYQIVPSTIQSLQIFRSFAFSFPLVSANCKITQRQCVFPFHQGIRLLFVSSVSPRLLAAVYTRRGRRSFLFFLSCSVPSSYPTPPPFGFSPPWFTV